MQSVGRPQGLNYLERIMLRVTKEQKDKFTHNQKELAKLIMDLIDNYVDYQLMMSLSLLFYIDIVLLQNVQS